MTNKELNLITEAVTKAILKHLSVYVRKIVREELEISGSLIQEEVVEQQPKKIDRKRSQALASKIFGNEFKEIIESTKPNIKIKSTGNQLLDEMIMTAPREEELITQKVKVPKQQPIPIEKLYENNVKGIPVDIAENLDFSGFLDKMDEMKGTPPPMGMQRGIYNIDKNDIVQEQKIGDVKIVKSYKA